MDEADAIRRFDQFLREKERAISRALAPLPRAPQRLSAGWALFYQSRAYVETGNFMALLVGHGPVVIRDDGEILEGGSLDHDAEALLLHGPYVERIKAAPPE